MAPILRGLAKEFDGRVVFVKVDVQSNRDLADQFEIKSIPTVVLFKNGKEWDWLSGVKGRSDPRKLLQKVCS
jgi:thioredoxin-like negative regulator of GroEL